MSSIPMVYFTQLSQCCLKAIAECGIDMNQRKKKLLNFFLEILGHRSSKIILTLLSDILNESTASFGTFTICLASYGVHMQTNEKTATFLKKYLAMISVIKYNFDPSDPKH
jgi:hypothetical protein